MCPSAHSLCFSLFLSDGKNWKERQHASFFKVEQTRHGGHIVLKKINLTSSDRLISIQALSTIAQLIALNREYSGEITFFLQVFGLKADS